jgi:glycosyltransferase involved in cell wall biosynthesis
MASTLCYFRTHIDDASNQGVVSKCKAIARAIPGGADSVFFTGKGLLFNDKLALPFDAPKHSWGHRKLYFLKCDTYLIRSIDFGQYHTFLVRHMPAHPRFVRLLAHAKRQNPRLRIVVEMPTWPYEGEQKGVVARLMGVFDRFFQKKMARYVDQFIYNGQPTEQILGRPALHLPNGIDVASVPFKGNEKRPQNGLRLIAVGSWSDWHGLDRLLFGMCLLMQNDDNISVVVVGDGPALAQLKAWTKVLFLEQHVRFVPPTSGAELDALFAQADIAIGSLGLHRIGLDWAAPLKHREYCARGIPFVFSGNDADFGDDCPFVLRFSPDDVPLDISRLLKWEMPDDVAIAMRAYAEEKLDWSVKLAKVF